MAHGTYNNPKVGTNGSKNRMKKLVDNSYQKAHKWGKNAKYYKTASVSSGEGSVIARRAIGLRYPGDVGTSKGVSKDPGETGYTLSKKSGKTKEISKKRGERFVKGTLRKVERWNKGK